MNNKSVLAVVTAQTAVIIGLLYLIWNQKSNELILNKNIILFTAIFSVALMIAVIFPLSVTKLKKLLKRVLCFYLKLIHLIFDSILNRAIQ